MFSRNKIEEINNLLIKNQFQIVDNDPDFIICYGGDGTILLAERKFPEIPKLIIKKETTCRKCDYFIDDLNDLLEKIREGSFRISKKMKLKVEYKNRKLIALNEVQIHTKLPIYAIRFQLTNNGIKHGGLIGDGVVIATPFGSTGYYKSTGGTTFDKGIGISFNNLHNKTIGSYVCAETSIVNVKIDRGPALVLADNNKNFFELNNQEHVTIRKSESVANFIY